ncbi:MAG TPA: hypothetical protein VMN38_01920 [Sphingomicrobium sp.]|nr:hypothetical protein [Sphingomicrobium sp.]
MITDLLAAEEDIEIVGSEAKTGNSLLAARAQGANMIITQEGAAVADQCLNAVTQNVPLTILAIAPGGSAGTSINLVRRQLRLDDDGAKSLAQAVRQAMEPA